jgi:tetratricopeptide (TPR) repeat protein
MGAQAKRLDEIHELLRRGRYPEARARIRALRLTRARREDRLRLAHAAFQAGLPAVSVRLLRPAVRPGRRGARAPTPEETFEYARALITLGGAREAIGLLEPIDLARLPRAARSLSWARFSRWEWNEALPCIERGLAVPGLSDFDRLFLLTRRANVLLMGRDDPAGASRILEGALRESRERGFRRIEMFSLQLLARAAFAERRWAEALARLDERAALYGDEERGELRAIDTKWRALVELARNPGRRSALNGLDRAMKELADVRDWEELRECEYHAALILKDEARVARFCYGTPYPAAREKILAAAGMTGSALPGTFAWPVGSASTGATPMLDVFSGENPFSKVRLKPGKALQRLLQALAQDFYVPPNGYVLHDRVFTDEVFNPLSSPTKVRQLVKRLRRWLDGARCPIELAERDGFYRLTGSRPVALLLRRDAHLAEPGDPKLAARLLELRSAFGGRSFRTAEAERRLGLGRTAAVGLLGRAVAEGILDRIGRGRNTAYRWPK